ncbi:SixA phosphatase family protein [Lunatibacter salilacus]|uniref:SixA phosphatase family protein n=1 Tax=Lunatibacter salilacus TaxID=2483804 RepID=UPI00131BAF5F|nr:histidine phosphatase family protein [Lunatibacter salilacus]
MKRLVICRHAKSAWDDPFLSDHHRPLAPRGLRDAPEMAKRLKKRGIYPDAILTSNARRALQTAQITKDELGVGNENIVITDQLYHAGSRSILNQIRHSLPDVDTLFIFGHNPGFNELIEALGQPIENLPTCGQYGIIFEVEKWEDIGAENALFWFFDYPKSEFPDIQ